MIWPMTSGPGWAAPEPSRRGSGWGSSTAEPVEFEPVSDAYEAACRASALVVLTEWPEFAGLDFERIRSAMATPVILDGKNLLAGLDLVARGFTYIGVGR